jgi:hypothetical protein
MEPNANRRTQRGRVASYRSDLRRLARQGWLTAEETAVGLALVHYLPDLGRIEAPPSRATLATLRQAIWGLWESPPVIPALPPWPGRAELEKQAIL